MNQNKSFFLLTLCSLFWAGNYVVGNIIVNEITPLWITFLRWLLSGIVLVPLANIIEKPDWREVMECWPALVVASLSGLGVYNVLLYTALSYTSAINATLINTFSPGLMAIVSMVVLKEKLSKLQILGIIISFLGVLVVLSRGSLAILMQAQFNKGDLLMFAALSSWILYTIAVKKITMPPFTFNLNSYFSTFRII